MKRPALEKALTKIVSNDTSRISLRHPFAYNKMVCATNGHVMVVTGHTTEEKNGTYLPLPLLKPVVIDATPPDVSYFLNKESVEQSEEAVTTVTLPDMEALAALSKLGNSDVCAWRYVVNKGILTCGRTEEEDVLISPRYLADVTACLYAGTGIDTFTASFTNPLSPVFIRPVSRTKVTKNSSTPSLTSTLVDTTCSDVGLIMPVRA